MAYGNGSGNGGDRVEVIDKDITDLEINLSTELLFSWLLIVQFGLLNPAFTLPPIGFLYDLCLPEIGDAEDDK